MSYINDENKIKVGAILEGNAGYSMVLPVFYKVISITPSGKSAKIRRLHDVTVSTTDGFTGTKVPDANRFRDAETITRRIKVADYGFCDPYEYVSGPSCPLHVWDGRPRHFDYLD